MTTKVTYLLIAFTMSAGILGAQPFELELSSFTISGLPGIQSYVSGTESGKWVIIGGRLNGLHGWQPPNAFPVASQNTEIYVVDPVTSQVWTAGTATLPPFTREHICASNHEFARIGDHLYVFGGYGFDTPSSDMITFPRITAINIPQLISDVISQSAISGNFRTIANTDAAITGGNARYMNGEIFLVMGHRFDGLYNPHNGPSFTQTYSEQIRKFTITDNGTTFTVSSYSTITDTVDFHRRDYNLVSQVLPGGAEAITAFSGVFRKNIDLPYFDNIDITPGGYTVNSGFEQKLNNYHSGAIPMYDSSSTTSYTLFMGGMAQYYFDMNGSLVNDSLVPFVKTISMITRDQSGQNESVLPYEMPGFLGSNMEFFPSDSVSFYPNGVLDLSSIDTTKTLIGYLFGGIEADYPYVFMQGGGTSWANEKVFKVYLKKGTLTSLPLHSYIEAFQVYPNPTGADHELFVDLTLARAVTTVITLYDITGQEVLRKEIGLLSAGKHTIVLDLPDLAAGSYQLMTNAGGAPGYRTVLIRE